MLAVEEKRLIKLMTVSKSRNTNEAVHKLVVHDSRKRLQLSVVAFYDVFSESETDVATIMLKSDNDAGMSTMMLL